MQEYWLFSGRQNVRGEIMLPLTLSATLKQNLKNRFGKNPKENIFIAAFLLVLSGASFYAWFVWPRSDQTLHVPMIYQLIDGFLFSRDYFITAANQNYASTFHHFMATISTVDNLFATYFGLVLTLNIIFVFTTFLLAKKILNNTVIALLVTVILSIYIRRSLEAVELSVLILSPRTLVFAFVPLIMYLYILNIQNYSRVRGLILFALLGLLYNFHPLSTLPIIIALLGTEIFYFKRFDAAYFAILIFLLALPANLHYLAVQSAAPSGEALEEIVTIRTSFHTFDYRIKALLGTLIYAPILAGIAYYMKQAERTETDKIVISWIVFFCSFSIVFIFISNFVSHKVIFYMLPRVWKYGYLLSIVYTVLLTSLLWKRIPRRLPLSRISAVLIILFLLGSASVQLSPVDIGKHFAGNAFRPAFQLLLTYDKPLGRTCYNLFYDSDNYYLNRIWETTMGPSKERQELKDIGDWLKKNTGKDTLIMSYPPQFQSLRAYSQRSMLVTGKDGGLGMLSEQVFRRWWNLYNEVKNGEPLEVAHKHHVDFILTESSIDLPLEKVLYTEHFNLYRM